MLAEDQGRGHARAMACAAAMRHNRAQRTPDNIREESMRCVPVALIATVLVTTTSALAAEEDIVLRGMGSFHVGGRIVEVSGKPVREIVRIPGGPPSKLDPNGQFMVEQMYVQ